MPTPHDIESFRQTGMLRVPGLFERARIAAAQAAVVTALAEIGRWHGGALRLPGEDRLAFPAKAPGLRALGKRYPAVETLLGDPGLIAAVDKLMDGQPHDRSVYPRPQLLVTVPNVDHGPVALGWHVDVPHLPSGESPGVQLFALIDDVAPGGGATLVMPGSHRLARPGAFLQNKQILARMREHDGLRAMLGRKCPVSPRERAAFMAQRARVDGVDVGIAELTGRAGDAWFVALGVLHSSSPNGTERARIMATHRFMHSSALIAMASGFGWDKQEAGASLADA